MSVTFTKLFSSITESTIWQEDDPTRIVWITMLAMADRAGRVWGSVPGLAHRARVSIPSTRKALAKFLGPDPDSRTEDFEGRRIEKIDGGWRLLNHAKYRAIRDEEAIKESKRKHINTKRAIERVNKAKAVDECRTPMSTVDRSRDNAEAAQMQKPSALGEQQASEPLGGGLGEGLSPTEPPAGFPKSEDDAAEQCNGVCLPDFARTTWLLAASRGWKDAKRVPISSWSHYLAVSAKYQRGREAENKASGRADQSHDHNNNHPDRLAASVRENLKQTIQRKRDELTRIGTADQHSRTEATKTIEDAQGRLARDAATYPAPLSAIQPQIKTPQSATAAPANGIP